MPCRVSVNDLVLVQGMHDTKLALAPLERAPWHVLRPWLTLSLLISLALLGVRLRGRQAQHARPHDVT